MARTHRRTSLRGVGPAERRLALRPLLGAYDTAVDTGWGLWMYACHIQFLRQQGAFDATLRWLIDRGLVEHRLETPSRSATRRTFKRARGNHFTQASCFVLTEAGARHARSLERRARKRKPATPVYDPQLRTLVFAGVPVKEFHRPSANQELLLRALQEQKWERRLDDPLPPLEGMDAKKRLSDTVYHLNKHQKHRLILFACDGTGTGLTWRPTFGSSSGVRRETNRRGDVKTSTTACPGLDSPQLD